MADKDTSRGVLSDLRVAQWLHFASLLAIVFAPGIADVLRAGEGLAKASAFPRKPIKVVVPFGAGGGSDTFTRIIQSAIEKNDLLPQPLVVINVPGAGGSIGSRRVKNARPDGYTILQIHEGMLTNKYSGNTNFGPESYVPIAGTGRMAHVIAVPEDSPWQSLKDLLDAAEGKPDSIVFAVGIGAPSHFAGIMLEAAHSPNTKFRFTQSGGGAKRFASLIGGHCDVSTFSVAEFIEFKKTGLKALAILSEERSLQEPQIPTAIEQGFDVVSTNMHFWWAPKRTPPEHVAMLADVLKQTMRTPEVQDRLSQLATTGEVLVGEDLEAELQIREERIRRAAPRNPMPMPNFAIGILVLTVASGLTAFGPPMFKGSARHGVGSVAASTSATHAKTRIPGVLLAVASIVYVATLHSQVLDYRLATILFVCGVGWSFCWRERFPRLAVAALSLLLGLGLHFLFTQVLVIDLP